MTFEQEFRKQWASVSNYISSEIIRAGDSGIDENRLQTMLDNEKRKWFLNGNYNNAWFEKLTMEAPETARRFEARLNSFKFKTVKGQRKNNSTSLFLMPVGGAILGFVPCMLFNANVKWTILATAGVAVVGFFGGKTIDSKRKEDMVNNICKEYAEQMAVFERELAEILHSAK